MEHGNDSRPAKNTMKKAIVIGASSGIGRELVKELLRNHYVVGAMARRFQLLNDLCKNRQDLVYVKEVDVTNTTSAMKKLEELIIDMGGVDLIVLCAGVGENNPTLGWLVEEMTIKTNVTGFAAMANVSMKHFMEQGQGHLVAISSVAALRGGRASPAYNASKAFESSYLEGLRQKAMKSRLAITISDIRPGYVKTVMAKGDGVFWATNPDEAARQIYQAIKRKKPIAYITHRWMLIAYLLKVIPRFIYERL